jgi:hypothetical protein
MIILFVKEYFTNRYGRIGLPARGGAFAPAKHYSSFGMFLFPGQAMGRVDCVPPYTGFEHEYFLPEPLHPSQHL